MKLVSVRFGDYGKDYHYYSDMDFIIGATYKIIADGTTSYGTPVIVTGFPKQAPKGIALRTITDAEIVSAPPRPKTKVEKVFFNKEKGTTVVKWVDGTTTKVKCQEGDTFSKEVGLALAFMKRICGNRGCYNEEFKKWCN